MCLHIALLRLTARDAVSPKKISISPTPLKLSISRFSALALGAAMFALTHSTSLAAEPAVALKVDWPKFLAQSDLVWDRLPANYYEGAFVGNGLLGAIVFKDDLAPNSLRFEIGRTDVYDHRPTGDAKHERCRLPIGQALFTPVGKITGGALRTDLWNAEVRGTLTTDAGRIEWRCFVPHDDNVVAVEWTATDGEKGAAFSFRPQQGNSPRRLMRPQEKYDYKPNPPFQLVQADGMDACVQPLLAGGDYATAWKTAEAGPGKKVFWLSVGNRIPATGSAEEAAQSVNKAIARGVPELEKAHRAWWHAYYPASFVTVPDPRVESFYWIQWYKLASAMRPDGPMVDLMGPWFRPSVWAAYWQNLNTELPLYTVHSGNHLELGDVMCKWLERDQAALIQNVPSEMRADSAALGRCSGLDLAASAPGTDKETGYQLIALPWLMQHCYMQYRYSMDEKRMKESFFPLLKRTFNTYLHIIKLGADGRYHIPNAYSDEYGSAEDTSLNLALLRWGMRTLIAVNDRCKLQDPLEPKWKETLAKLADDPVDEKTGIMIGKDTPFSKPHRHYSHLFSIFPLYTLNVEDQPEKRPLMEQSVHHFIELEGDNCLFKYTGASSLFAAMGDGDEALARLHDALRVNIPGPHLTPNTLYSENGWPTFESPISASRNVLDMLLQSWGGTIRVFTSCPKEWQDASFYDLRAEGAFLVSAQRQGGKTRFVRVKSLAGEPCRIKCDLAEPVSVAGEGTPELQRKDGLFELNLKKGEEAVLYTKGAAKPFVVAPLQSEPAKENAWGVKSGS